MEIVTTRLDGSQLAAPVRDIRGDLSDVGGVTAIAYHLLIRHGKVLESIYLPFIFDFSRQLIKIAQDNWNNEPVSPVPGGPRQPG
jgi:hypothetical protein